jgi:hypothetical protein
MATDLDTFTLAGDPIARATHALEVARHQVRVAQVDAPARLENALVEAEDVISEQLACIKNALADAAADAEESGAADCRRWEWYPRYRAA